MKRCYRCMGRLGEEPVCPHCGYDSRKGQEILYALQPGTVLHGKYLIGNVLGQGGFGITYLGFDMILEVKVAIKEYYVSGKASRMGASSQKVYWTADPGDMNHFITEARRMAQLEKMPEIANVRDVFYDNQTTYIIMEYVEGVTLSGYLERTGPLSYEQAVRLMLPVIDALGRVHGKGLVHRDISPDNLMREPQGTLRILDMGAAGDLTRNNGQASQLVARRGFSPYEQYVEDGKIGPWTDVYAVCATIYYCCTGRLIPDVHARMDQYMRTRKSELTLDAVIPPAGAKVLQKGLALEVEHRIGNMAALAEQLKNSLKIKPEPKPEPEPEEAWDDEPDPEINPELLAKLKRNQKPLLIGAAAILAIVVGAAAISSMGGEKEPTIPIPLTETKETMRTAEETTAAVTEATAVETTEETAEETNGEYTWEPGDYEGETAPALPWEPTVPPEIATFTYGVNETGLTITGYEGELPAKMVLPREINGKLVTMIGDRAFKGCTGLTSVTIPNSVTSTGVYAFAGCTNLNSVTIPGGVKEIGWGSFKGCTSLTSVMIPNSVTLIGNDAFIGCTSLTSVTIPDNVTMIGEAAFGVCTSLASVTIPDSVTKIRDRAFMGCTSLTSVTIPDSVTEIGYEAFRGCTSLNKVTTVLASELERIRAYAFAGCISLNSFFIPPGCHEIAAGAFPDSCELVPMITLHIDEPLETEPTT